MKLRSFLYALAATATALLVTAAGIFVWITSQSPLNALQQARVSNPTAAMFVPRQAPVMVSLLVNPERLEEFRQLAAPVGNRRQALAQLRQLEKSLLANTDIDYQRDIQPWLGNEITLAVTSLDFDRNRENAAQPGYLLAATTQDAQRAREFVQLYYSKEATAGTTDLVVETYKGVNLLYRRPVAGLASYTAGQQTPETLTMAVVGDRFVLFANHPKVLRSALNNVQVASLRLEDDPEYQQMLTSLKAVTKDDSSLPYQIGVSFVNLPSLVAWISNQPIPVRESFKASETLAIVLSVTQQGIVAKTALLGTQPSVQYREPLLSQPVGALNYIPSRSVLAIAGTDLNQFWNQLTANVANDEALEGLVNQFIGRLESRWQLDLPQEIFSWVDGEYALSILSRSDRTEPDFVFVAQNVPEADTQAGIEHLDTLAKQRGLSVGLLPLEGKPVTAWTKLVTSATATTPEPGNKPMSSLMRLEAEVYGVHTTVEDYEIFTTSIDAMAQALAGVENSLLNTDRFQEAIAPLPNHNDGYIYLDWNQGETLVGSQFSLLQVFKLVAKPLFDHLRSIGVSSYGVNNGVQQSQLFLRLE